MNYNFPYITFSKNISNFYKRHWCLNNQEWMDNVTSGNYQKYYETMYGK